MKLRSYILFLLCLAAMTSFGQTQSQNLIRNPQFNAVPGLGNPGICEKNASQIEYWDNMPYWELPKAMPWPTCWLGWPASTDIWYNNKVSPDHSIRCLKGEYAVGSLTHNTVQGGLYYIEEYYKGSPGGEFAVLATNRPKQCGYNALNFQGNTGPWINMDPTSQTYVESPSSVWVRSNGMFVANGAYDRIVFGTTTNGGNGNSNGASGYIDDVKLIYLGPGGFCPQNRYLQNATFTSEEFTLTASEYIYVGDDVNPDQSVAQGTVTIEGTAQITCRAGINVIIEPTDQEVYIDPSCANGDCGLYAYIGPCYCDPLLVNAGPDIDRCDIVNSGGSIQLGSAPQPGVTYEWTSVPPTGIQFLSDPNIANPIFTPTTGYDSHYEFYVTATNLCLESATDGMDASYIRVVDNTPDIDVEFNVDNIFYVSADITPEPNTYEIVVEHWNANGTALHHINTLIAGTHFQENVPFTFTVPEQLHGCTGHKIVVKARNECSNVWDTHEYFHPIVHTGPGVHSILNSVLTPNGDGINDAIMLEHNSGYHFYELYVWDASQQQSGPNDPNLYHSYGVPGPSPMVLWDGTGHNNYVTYFFRLYLMECFQPPIEITGFWTLLAGSGRLEDPNASDLTSEGNDAMRNITARITGEEEGPLLHIVPNPNNGQFVIACDEMAVVEVYNAMGSLVDSFSPSNSTLTISGLSQGVYLVRAFDKEGQSTTERVVVY